MVCWIIITSDFQFWLDGQHWPRTALQFDHNSRSAINSRPSIRNRQSSVNFSRNIQYVRIYILYDIEVIIYDIDTIFQIRRVIWQQVTHCMKITAERSSCVNARKFVFHTNIEYSSTEVSFDWNNRQINYIEINQLSYVIASNLIDSWK